jgi:hypothetical protein
VQLAVLLIILIDQHVHHEVNTFLESNAHDQLENAKYIRDASPKVWQFLLDVCLYVNLSKMNICTRNEMNVYLYHICAYLLG